MGKPNVLFVLTIDTEEEWRWDEEFPQHNCSVQNVKSYLHSKPFVKR